MLAKRLFWICGGIFLLALIYQMGARNVTAGVFGIEGASIRSENGVNFATFTSNRVFYAYSTAQSSGEWVPYDFPPPTQPIPGGDAIVSTSVGGGYFLVLLANGDAYDAVADGGAGQSWTYGGNLLGATPAVRESWGALKSRYR